MIGPLVGQGFGFGISTRQYLYKLLSILPSLYHMSYDELYLQHRRRQEILSDETPGAVGGQRDYKGGMFIVCRVAGFLVETSFQNGIGSTSPLVSYDMYDTI